MSKAEVIYEKVRDLSDTAQAVVLRTVELLSDKEPAEPPTPPGQDRLSKSFRELAETWRRETSFLSFGQQRALHPAYQRIIGMGPPALPLIFRELERRPSHWFWALRAITGEDPVRPEGAGDNLDVDSARQKQWNQQLQFAIPDQRVAPDDR